MDELISLDTNNEEFPVDARELWEKLESGQKFADWIKDRIEKYSFIAGQDFFVKLRKTSGRPAEEYRFTLDTGKELAMVENNDKGRQIRRYFIEAEKKLRVYQIGKVIRRELTDALKESGLNEKMHGFGYKTFTDLIYKLVLGMDAKHYRAAFGLDSKANVRQYVTEFQLQQIVKLEKAIQSWIDCGFNYNEIKQMLEMKALPLNQLKVNVATSNCTEELIKLDKFDWKILHRSVSKGSF